MKLGDIIALAKQGYKPSDIRELIAMADTEEEPEAEPEEEAEEPEAEAEEETEAEPEAEEEEKPKEPDYKAMYEKSQKDLKAAQAVNRKKNIGENQTKTPEEILQDLVNDF